MKSLAFNLGLFCAVFAAPALASDPWKPEEQVAGAALGALILVDYLQTRQIAKYPEQYHEVNLILGEHPSIGKVNNYFMIASALTYIFIDALPSEYRSYVLAAGIVVQAGVVAGNFNLGIKARW